MTGTWGEYAQHHVSIMCLSVIIGPPRQQFLHDDGVRDHQPCYNVTSCCQLIHKKKNSESCQFCGPTIGHKLLRRNQTAARDGIFQCGAQLTIS
ncbi:hypothetical protein X777_03954 [Ooceraea biroi]|uniref:Uncharacterized protein n=1 Tax=Ooceraea biroi TaxID=2015173 RepID=A0A026WKZ5_OOCBI|nr:hypothetical protein X777_03954 [Ooceraea biroi]